MHTNTAVEFAKIANAALMTARAMNGTRWCRRFMTSMRRQFPTDVPHIDFGTHTSHTGKLLEKVCRTCRGCTLSKQ